MRYDVRYIIRNNLYRRVSLQITICSLQFVFNYVKFLIPEVTSFFIVFFLLRIHTFAVAFFVYLCVKLY